MIRSPRILLPLVLALVVACLAGPAVAASNLAPNPGFETCSAGAPSEWLALPQVTIACDSGNPFSGSSSMHVVSSQDNQFGSSGGGISDCITSGISGGTAYDVALAYRTVDPNASHVVIDVQFNSDAACSHFVGDTGADAPLTAGLRDGHWHQLTGTATAPANANSATVVATVFCNVCTTGTGLSTTANFDDVSFTAQGTTAARFLTLSAVATPAGTSVRWRTASELDVAGFNVYRAWHGKRLRVNNKLIPAVNAARGHGYRYLDRHARPGGRYWIQAVNLDASVSWYGSARVR